ncbi:hypothetical protein [Shinella sp. BYT-45]|uniref:hypothetical protein n=1 Tax=Shinella sp. BYT-45 TaxID=3377377 RepID=UPI0039803453
MRTSHSEMERLALDQLEPQFVRRGYKLIRNPSRAELPSFIEGYVPDAIAVGRKPNIALEIKGRGSPQVEGSLARIRELFNGRDDWEFQVYYFNSLAPLVAALPAGELDQIVKRIESLSGAHNQASFMLAWSVLEASAREAGLIDDKPVEANRMVGVLASEGYIRSDEVSELLELASLRIKLAHGQLDIEPSRADVKRVLELVSQIRTPDEGGARPAE